jgi:hypothetical protein
MMEVKTRSDTLSTIRLPANEPPTMIGPSAKPATKACRGECRPFVRNQFGDVHYYG